MGRVRTREEIANDILAILGRIARICFRKIFHHEHEHSHGNNKYEGEMVVCHGVHKIFVKTGKTPKRVWISEEDCGYPVCHGYDENSYSVFIVKGGFFLLADIHTDHAHIKWFIRYDSRLHDDKHGHCGAGKF
jgi:hypothetical protein